MRTLDLLRNRPWNMQAVIVDGGPDGDLHPFYVEVGPITGPDTGLEKTTLHYSKVEAYNYAYVVLGFDGEYHDE